MLQAEYDICLSFAGEERPYVESVAAALRSAGVSVFYDRYEEVDLWGKDLYQHLAHVYQSAKYCVVFVSAAYARKLWTRHELKAAQARAFEENREYILPARFDDTEIPGLLSTVMYVDLRTRTPQNLAEMTVQKLQGQKVPLPQKEDTGPVPTAQLRSGRLLSIAIIAGADAGTVYRVKKPVITIGHAGADLIINDSEASRQHAVIEVRDRVVLLEDLKSANGTLVDGNWVTEPVELQDKSEFQIGGTTLMLIVTEDPFSGVHPARRR